MRHGSLFSGIGGFDLAATWMGWQNVFHCEKNEFCQQLLKFYWPKAESYGDIFGFNAVKFRGLVDIISGGFPCQPFSLAGQRRGETDDRYLWPEARRIIMEARPRWIVLENVAGLFTILEQESLSKMEIKDIELFCADREQPVNTTIVSIQRRVIGRIISEIESAGYVLPKLENGTPVVLCIPAAAVNAPHRRDRVLFVAHSCDFTDFKIFDRWGGYDPSGEGNVPEGKTAEVNPGWPDRKSNQLAERREEGTTKDYGGRNKPVGPASNPNGTRLEGAPGQGFPEGGTGQPAWHSQIYSWNDWPTESPVLSGDDGLSSQLDGITFSNWRSESIRGFGNAIVPQVALELFKNIQACEGIEGL